MIKNNFTKLIITFLFIFLYKNTALAERNYIKSDHAEVSLLGGSYLEGKAQLGLNFKLEPGWHIYWRIAGDTGFPTTLDWSGSTNIQNVEVSWPKAVKEIEEIAPGNILESYIYKDEVTLPVIITTQEPESHLDAHLHVSYAICSKICVPGDVTLTLNLKTNYKSPENIRKINSAIELIAAENAKPKPIAGQEEGFALILTMIIFAFIGGVILNVMPCVLPILSIKLLGVIKHGGGNKHEVTLSFLVTAIGIIVSFLAFAIIAIWLKELGHIVGWGMGFQQPYFIITLVVILTLFAANMWGLYEININIPLLDNRKGFLGHFISGVLATVLATPCTAPFLGVAIGFAVTRGAFEIIIIFFAMGLGLALPYLLLSLFPGLITILPKPGKWMVTIKKTMGVLLAISAVWLIWVLEGQLGRVAAIILLLLCVIKVLKLWAADHFGLIRKIKIPLMVFIIFLSFIIPVKVSNNSDKPLQDAHAMWEDFYPEHIAGLVKNGKIVFVDVTANWCLTCKVNKFAVLERQEIQAEFLRLNVVAMQANWTNRDADIAKYLMENHRAGIPFNIVYGPGAPDGIILSELLTTNDVKEALKKAAGK